MVRKTSSEVFLYETLTSSTHLRGMWKKLNSNFNFTCVCKSEKQSLIFLSTSLFNWEHIDELNQESDEAVPNLLCSHKDVSRSLEGREAMFFSFILKRCFQNDSLLFENSN